jgi:hypothetical protein
MLAGFSAGCSAGLNCGTKKTSAGIATINRNQSNRIEIPLWNRRSKSLQTPVESTRVLASFQETAKGANGHVRMAITVLSSAVLQ